MYVTNRFDFGHLIKAELFELHFKNELYEIDSNRFDWEKRYLNGNFTPKFTIKAKSPSWTGHYLNIFFCSLFLLYLIARWARSRLLCNTRIFSIVFVRKITNIFNRFR